MLQASTSSGASAEASFLRAMVSTLRSQTDPSAWDGNGDEELLAQLLAPHGGVQARDDPDVYWRIEQFFAAVGLAIERRTGIPCTAMLRMSAEYGRVVVIAGRLVVASTTFREVGRFGFETIAKLREAGERLVEGGVALIVRFPEVARATP